MQTNTKHLTHLQNYVSTYLLGTYDLPFSVQLELQCVVVNIDYCKRLSPRSFKENTHVIVQY